MCKDLWRFPLEWGNGNKYGKNNQRRAFEVGKTDSGKGHGSYWYAYFTYQGKTHSIYVGKEKREIDPLKELEKKKNRKRGLRNNGSFQKNKKKG